jgi:hypothetical protein
MPCYLSYSGGRRKRILVQGQPGQKSETKFEKQKCSVAQVAQHLPRKHEALSADSSIAKQQQILL